jgi:hypothetical protein
MRLRRILLIVAAVLAIAFGLISFGMLAGGERTAGACQICGDGYCARSCENKYTCPRDCGGSTGTTAATR